MKSYKIDDLSTDFSIPIEEQFCIVSLNGRIYRDFKYEDNGEYIVRKYRGFVGIISFNKLYDDPFRVIPVLNNKNWKDNINFNPIGKFENYLELKCKVISRIKTKNTK